MKARITLITIGVDDLDRSLRFYRDGLGLKTEGIVGAQFEYGAVVFFELQAGLRLALWPRTSIVHDSNLPVGRPSPTEFTIAHNVNQRLRSMSSWNKPEMRVRLSSSRLTMHSGAGTSVTSRTQTSI
jgi:catechol 2,3-dioxygenase-like lactoylglutathione lyase family enzyme